MVILAIIMFVLGIALLKEGTSDAAKVGGILLALSLAVFVWRIWQVDLKTYDAFVFWFCSGFVKIWFGFLQFLGLIVAMVFLGPLLMLFGKK